jgi:predicted P-loop ATPase
MLIAAVARIMEPGCKADHIVILEGEQGTLKSTALDVMFRPYFSDDLSEFGSKDSRIEMNGVWCLELAELTSMRRADVERVKAFASRRIDRFRPSYGRHVIEAPRQCVLIGTTNGDSYLKDESGARRFWPLRCGRIDIDLLARDRDQLWGEATSLYRAGEPWWLTDLKDIAAARAEQDDRYIGDAWSDVIGAYVRDRDEVTVTEILAEAVGKPKEQWTQVDYNRVVACLRAQRCWVRARGPKPLQRRLYRRSGG